MSPIATTTNDEDDNNNNSITANTSTSSTIVKRRTLTRLETSESMHGALAGSGSTWQEAFVGLASGIAFGMVTPVVGHPFDTVKTRMQAEIACRDFNFRQTVKHIYVTDGIRGFYRGFIPPLIGSMIFRGLQFSAYAGAYAACEHVPVLHEPIPYTAGLRPSVLMGVLAASLARASVESPLDFIKLRIMIGKQVAHGTSTTTTTTSSNFYATTIQQLAKSPISSVQHLYQGYSATFLRTVGLLGSFFIMVDYAVRYIPEVVNAPVYGPFFKGGICATTAWLFAFPFESAKSVIQADHNHSSSSSSNSNSNSKNMHSQRRTTLQVLAQLYRERGIVRGWYRGFGPGASRSFFANGASMMVYSYFQDAIRKGL